MVHFLLFCHRHKVASVKVSQISSPEAAQTKAIDFGDERAELVAKNPTTEK